MKHSALILALSLYALGCSAVPTQPQTHELMSSSLKELADGHVPEARRLLDEARDEASVYDSGPIELDFLEAEILLAEGRLDEASSLAKEILVENPKDPLAHEIAAKCLIRAGAFSEAESHLLSALGSHARELDRARVQDLLNLVWGLSAYSRGRVSEATKIWGGINDDGLRNSINEIVKSFTEPVAAR